MTSTVTVTGGSLRQRNRVESVVDFCIQKLMPRMNNLEVIVKLVDIKTDAYGYCSADPEGGAERLDRPREFELEIHKNAALTRYRRDHVGFVFQFYNLMPSLTARENVELVTEIARDPMDPDEALALVGLRERTDHFPAQLSGGEQQRVAIARAIAKQPDVLFCDEPTGALDSATGRSVLRVLEDVNKRLGSTVLMVTHAASQAQMADRVIHFADGAIREIVENRHKLAPEDIEW